MGVFVPLYGGVQAELVFVLDSVIVSNRLWFWTDALLPPSTAEFVGCANGLYEWHTEWILPYLSSSITLQTVVVRDWSFEGAVGEVTTYPPAVGGVASESSTANVSVVVPFRWPLQFGRRKKNKNYVPGVPEAEISLNTPSAAIRGVLFEGYVALIDAARTWSPGDYWYWVVTSAYADNLPREEQSFGLSTGPLPAADLVIGQRRKRLPES